LEQLRITIDGYAMPLELWAQAAMLGLNILEIPVPLIYLDLARSFGGALDDGGVRLNHYNQVIDESILAMQARGYELPKPSAVSGCGTECC
jgi:dolichol-phosphate mannosyltransferase